MLPMQSMKLKVNINDRTYSNWSFLDNETNKNVNLPDELCKQIDPTVYKLFSRDVIEVIYGEGYVPNFSGSEATFEVSSWRLSALYQK